MKSFLTEVLVIGFMLVVFLGMFGILPVSAQVLDFQWLSPPPLKAPAFIPGDIFLTRNANEEDNTSPGHWNHCGIFVGDGQIVEAQAEPGAVVYCPLDEFMGRYPEITVLRLRVGSERYGEAAALRATQLVGNKYRLTASIFKVLRRVGFGENCVSVVRKSYRQSTGVDPRWRIPDSVLADQSLEVIYPK